MTTDHAEMLELAPASSQVETFARPPQPEPGAR